jgi:hypothetical protein
MLSDRKVDVMIIGAQKAGTTSLKNYLGQHPSIITHLQTEFSFFLVEKEYDGGIETAFKNYFSDADPNSDNTKKVVAKSAGMYVNELSMQRLKASNPNCLIVLLLRNPVDRAYSSYLMEVNSGWFDESWSTIKSSLKKFRNGERDQMFRLFIEMGMYADQLKKIYRCFSKEQVLIFNFDDLKKNPSAVCKKIFSAMDTDAAFIADTSQRFNPSKRPRAKQLSKIVTWMRFDNNPVKQLLKFILPPSSFIQFGHWVTNSVSRQNRLPTMDSEVRLLLCEFFKPYNNALQDMTGMDFEQWNH